MSINESGAGAGCKGRVTAAVAAAVVVAAAVLRGAEQRRRRRDNGWLKTFCQLDRACAVRDYY